MKKIQIQTMSYTYHMDLDANEFDEDKETEHW